ncbi:hypothetical protein H3S89_03915 [Bartonella sp. B10834G6]|uniref:hypothetical protein n=1 Tax=Bartonella apis TaxID=1686310 RepID=UPI0018DD5847|nr:hypothetical protein [Bartonella apis]MBH9981941.1 hypothetical protein [Bartonella apis]MBI0176730.1 hypothetical protein [Bartonella apis]
MMPTSSQRYARLLKAQKLVKARDEAELEGTQTQRSALTDEDQFLFSIMEHGSASNLFDPMMVSKRLDKNARKEAILDNIIAQQRKTLLQSTRRCDVIDEKRKAAEDAEERKEMAQMLEEYVAAKIVKDTSLG